MTTVSAKAAKEAADKVESSSDDTATGAYLKETCQTVQEAACHWATHIPEMPAFIFRSADAKVRTELSYGEWYTLAGRWSRWLHERGVGRNQFVVNALPNSPERAISDLGITMCGAASVNGICQLRDASDLKDAMRKSAAVAVIMDPDVMPDQYASVLDDVTPSGPDGAVTSKVFPALKFVLPIRRKEGSADGKDERKETRNAFSLDGDFLSGLRQRECDVYRCDDVSPDDVYIVFATSGTTGFSKLVPYTHKLLLANFRRHARPFHTKEFIMSPLGWAGGQVTGLILHGATRILRDDRAGISSSGSEPPDPLNFLHVTLTEEKPLMAFLPPYLLPGLAAKIEKEGLQSYVVSDAESGILEAAKKLQETEEEAKYSSQDSKQESESKDQEDKTKEEIPAAPPQKLLTVAMLGGQPLLEVHVRAALVLAHVVVTSYGSTECLDGTMSMITSMEVHRDYMVGGPMIPTLTMKVVDENGKETEVDKEGDIIVKSPFMFTGYLHDAEATRKAFNGDGFLLTGDRGWRDEKDQVYVLGRAQDAISRGSYIFFPGWLEKRIRGCPQVADVLVVGVPHPTLGSELCACVILATGTGSHVTLDDVRRWVENEITADDMLSPRPRFFLEFPDFPMTVSSKIKRKEMTKLAVEKLGAAGELESA